ncbi:hypothetical protein SRHO_G00180780 [Serrasalmus rhombeus]
MAYRHGGRPPVSSCRVQEASEIQTTHVSLQASPPCSASYGILQEEKKENSSSLQEQLIEKDQYITRLQETLRLEREKNVKLQSRFNQQGLELRRREQHANRMREKLFQFTDRHRERGAWGVVLEWTQVKKRLRELQSESTVAVRTDQEKFLAQLEEELAQSRELVRVQQQLLQDNVDSPLPAALIDSYYLEEWERLQDRWVELKHQRRSFQQERQAFTEAAIRLGHERCVFQQQKAALMKQQFLTTSPITKTSHSNRRESTALGELRVAAPDSLALSPCATITPSSEGSEVTPRCFSELKVHGYCCLAPPNMKLRPAVELRKQSRAPFVKPGGRGYTCRPAFAFQRELINGCRDGKGRGSADR